MSINQLLPVVILCLLLNGLVDLTRKQLLVILGSGIVCSFAYVQSAAIVSQLFEHRGLEFTQIMVCCIIFIASLLACNQQKWAASVAIISAMVLYLSHYIIYIVGFWQAKEAAEPLLIGTLLGVGICFSFGTLFYFLLETLKTHFGDNSLHILLASNATAKLLIVIDLASQIDVLDITTRYVDWRGFIAENSELGRVLKALMGYEATPSLTALWVYTAAFSVFVLVCLLIGKKSQFKETL